MPIRFGRMIVIVVTAIAALPATSWAHVLVTDGTMGVVMHLDPNDSPIAGQQSTAYFDIHDTTNRFQPEYCNCRLIVQHGDQIVFSGRTAVQRKLNNLAAFIVFPNRGVYTMTLTGKPLGGATFRAFTVNFTMRVDRITAPPQQTSFTRDLGSLIPLLGLLVYLTSRLRSRKLDTNSIST